MTLVNEHRCPMCTREHIPIWRALCRGCFSITPWKLRADFMHAYRARVVDPIAWQEYCIHGRQWFLGRSISEKDEANSGERKGRIE